MEESLKRLKKGKNKAGGATGPTDDDKIRLQLLLDVKGYGEQVCKKLYLFAVLIIWSLRVK